MLDQMKRAKEEVSKCATKKKSYIYKCFDFYVYLIYILNSHKL